MRVAVVGSRGFPVGEALPAGVVGPVDRVRDFVRSLPPGTIVVSGGARGVDRTAEDEARRLGLTVRSLPADWERHGRKAGFLRNRVVVELASRGVAFWDGVSPGTKSTIGLFNAARKPVSIRRAP